jgi:hypothetical protein
MMTAASALTRALLSYGLPSTHSKLAVDGVCIALTSDSLKGNSKLESLAPVHGLKRSTVGLWFYKAYSQWKTV